MFRELPCQSSLEDQESWAGRILQRIVTPVKWVATDRVILEMWMCKNSDAWLRDVANRNTAPNRFPSGLSVGMDLNTLLALRRLENKHRAFFFDIAATSARRILTCRVEGDEIIDFALGRMYESN